MSKRLRTNALLLGAVTLVSSGVRADEALQVSLLFKTLAYEDALPTRLVGDRLTALVVGRSCDGLLKSVSVGSKRVSCKAVPTVDAALAAAATEPSVLVLVGASATRDACAVALAKSVTVLTVGAAASPEALLNLPAARVVVGALALKRLGARFPASVLRSLEVLNGPAMPPALPEFAFPPRPPPGAQPAWPAGATGAEATVVVKVGVLETGAVMGVELVKGDEPFASTAMAAVRSWVWEAARLDDTPIAASTVFRVVFRPP